MSETDANSELVVLYLSECEQMIQIFEKTIMDSDKDEKLTDSAELFRILHTLKGSSAMMDYTPLVETAHAFEDILAIVKNNDNEVIGNDLQALVDAGLDFASYFLTQLSNIRNNKVPQKDENLFETIAALAHQFGVHPTADVKKDTAAPRHIPLYKGEICVKIHLRNCPIPHIRAFIIAKSVLKLCSFLSTYPENIEKATEYDDTIQNDGFEIRFIPIKPNISEDVIKKLEAQPYVESCTNITQAVVNVKPQQPPSVTDLLQNLTVPQSHINKLIGYVDEIASAEAAIEDYIKQSPIQSGQLYRLLHTLNRTVADTGILASQLGKHDIGSVFIQMQRAIRSMAKDLHKDIKVKVVGADVQVDKSIIEILSDSLIHIVRNAADHGIETSDRRIACGKSTVGTITLTAAKKNDYITVTVADDGAGINRKTILDKAKQLGTLTKAQELYTDEEVNNLLLTSGFSTSTNVTQYSGRGVGLDTVVRRVHQAGGTLSINSKNGYGTTFCLKIPITLMIIDGIEISLDGINEMIVPANAIGHILTCSHDKYDCSDDNIIYRGKKYTQLLFPGEQAGLTKKQGGYVLLLTSDYKPYFIRAKNVSMMSTYYVKQMPEYVSDILGSDYIYSGCVLGANAGLRCVLDIDKLIGTSQSVKLSERQINL